MSKKQKDILFYISVLVLILLTFILIRFIKLYDIFCKFLSISLPILFGYVFAWILYPLYKKLFTKLGKKLTILLLILTFVIIYVLIVYSIIPIILKEGANFMDTIDIYITKLKKYPIFSDIENYTKIDTNTFLASCNNVIAIIVNFALIHLFGFYILYNYELINSYLKKCIPLRYKDATLKFFKKLSHNMRFYIKGTLIDTLVLFLITGILFSLVGLKSSIILALFCAITNIIPFVGPYIGGIPAVLIGLTTSVKLGVITLIIIVFSQTVESNIINPLIMSKCVNINPLLIIIAITIMGNIFGIFGMFFAVPILILLKIAIEFYKKYRLQNR